MHDKCIKKKMRSKGRVCILIIKKFNGSYGIIPEFYLKIAFKKSESSASVVRISLTDVIVGTQEVKFNMKYLYKVFDKICRNPNGGALN